MSKNLSPFLTTSEQRMFEGVPLTLFEFWPRGVGGNDKPILGALTLDDQDPLLIDQSPSTY